MAIFHLEIGPIKRSLGQKATAAAAYRAGERIHDQRTGTVHDHSRRSQAWLEMRAKSGVEKEDTPAPAHRQRSKDMEYEP